MSVQQEVEQRSTEASMAHSKKMIEETDAKIQQLQAKRDRHVEYVGRCKEILDRLKEQE